MIVGNFLISSASPNTLQQIMVERFFSKIPDFCHAEFLLSFSIDQSFKRLSKLVTGTLENLNLAVNLKKKILQKYGSVVIF
jgi:hypothetical protein